MLEADARTKQDPSNLTELVYELLDAHADTIVLAGGTPATAGLRPAAGLPPADRTPAWAAHLDYLRDLQRVARECLARLS